LLAIFVSCCSTLGGAHSKFRTKDQNNDKNEINIKLEFIDALLTILKLFEITLHNLQYWITLIITQIRQTIDWNI
jgi:hypothetical protein